MPDGRTAAGLITLPEARRELILSQIVGRTLHSGLLGCVLNATDWSARTAAVTAFKAVCIEAGPSLKIVQVDQIVQAIQSAKQDKAKPVRSAAREAFALYAELQVHPFYTIITFLQCLG